MNAVGLNYRKQGVSWGLSENAPALIGPGRVMPIDSGTIGLLIIKVQYLGFRQRAVVKAQIVNCAAEEV